MISPQQSATTAMGELTWAQVMPAEAYWRERIAKEIEALCDDSCQLYDRIEYHNGHVAAEQVALGKGSQSTHF